MEWLLPFVFWLLGFLVMLSGAYVSKKLSQKKSQLAHAAQAKRTEDAGESIYIGMEKNLLDGLPWFSIRLTSTILGMILIVIGFMMIGFIV